MNNGSEALPDVTVIVPTFDRRSLLAETLAGLDRQDYPPERLEVVVVDDGSTDGTADLVAAWSPPFARRLVVMPENRGPGPARNAGVAVATGSVLAFTDSDCVPQPGWIRAGVAAFEPGVGIVQGRTIPDGEDGPWVVTQRLESFTGRFETCNIFYRADALRATDGFAEDLGFLFDDVVAGWSVLRTGVRATFAPRAVVGHAVSAPGFAWFLRRTVHYDGWSGVVRRFPEVREELLWGRFFLRPRNAAFLGAVLGIAALRRWPRLAAAAIAPYAFVRSPRSLTRDAIVGEAKGTLFDAAVFVALVRGSIRHRALVL